MTTIGRAMPAAQMLGDIGARTFDRALRMARQAMFSSPQRRRSVHELSDWILDDIGLPRNNRMSAEARRTMHRLSRIGLW